MLLRDKNEALRIANSLLSNIPTTIKWIYFVCPSVISGFPWTEERRNNCIKDTQQSVGSRWPYKPRSRWPVDKPKRPQEGSGWGVLICDIQGHGATTLSTHLPTHAGCTEGLMVSKKNLHDIWVLNKHKNCTQWLSGYWVGLCCITHCFVLSPRVRTMVLWPLTTTFHHWTLTAIKKWSSTHGFLHLRTALLGND